MVLAQKKIQNPKSKIQKWLLSVFVDTFLMNFRSQKPHIPITEQLYWWPVTQRITYSISLFA